LIFNKSSIFTYCIGADVNAQFDVRNPDVGVLVFDEGEELARFLAGVVQLYTGDSTGG